MTEKIKGYSPNLLSIWRGVRPALKNVPGLRRRIQRIGLISTAVFALLTLAVLLAFDQWVIDGYLNWMQDRVGSQAVMASVFTWLMYIIVGALAVIINLRIVIALASFWNDALVGDVIRHFRPLPDLPFDRRRFMRDLGRSVLFVLRDLVITLILLFVGMISVVGLPLVLAAEVLISGTAIRASYVDVLRGAGEPAQTNRRRLRASIIHLGLLPTLLSLLPFVGWLLIPPIVVLQLIGFTWDAELRRARTDVKQPDL